MSRDQTNLGIVNKKDAPASIHIPYTRHINDTTIKTANSDYIQVIKLSGVSFNTLDEDMINNFHIKRNILLQNIQDPRFSIWTTTIKEKTRYYPSGEYDLTFAKGLDAKYKETFKGKDLYRIDHYVTLCIRDFEELKVLRGLKFFSKAIQNDQAGKRKELIQDLNTKTEEVIAALSQYEPELLGTYQYKGNVYSRPYEFLGRLINGIWQRIPLTTASAPSLICNSRLNFGRSTAEIINQTRTFVAGFGIKEYPSITGPGMLDPLLNLDMSFVLTQSFTFSEKTIALSKLKETQNKMIVSGDLSETQIGQLSTAMDELASGEFSAGSHHFNLMVYGKSLEELERNINVSGSELANSGVVRARETLGFEAGFWAQLPANYSYRPRVAPLITSRNFAGLAPFHNHVMGSVSNNKWGDPLCMFKTDSDTPYVFSLHNQGGGTPPGNGVIIGPTGSGKTALMSYMVAMSNKYDKMRVVYFDKDNGAELIINAMDGEYLTLERGVKTGFAPLQIEPTPENIDFLQGFIISLAYPDASERVSIRDQKQLAEALTKEAFFSLPIEQRRIGSLVQYLDFSETEGLAARLEIWTEAGQKGWIFDNETDRLNLDNSYLGFDMTDVLDMDDVRSPITRYITHRVDEIMDGQNKVMIVFDEGWKYLNDAFMENKIADYYRTIRKRNGVIILGTNNAGDIKNSETGKLVFQQAQFQILFPNAKALEEDYVDVMSVTKKEFEIIKFTPEHQRKLLIKRGVNSNLVRFDLAGLDDELAVLSSTSSSVALLRSMKKEYLNAPFSTWLDDFHKQRKINKGVRP